MCHILGFASQSFDDPTDQKSHSRVGPLCLGYASSLLETDSTRIQMLADVLRIHQLRFLWEPSSGPA